MYKGDIVFPCVGSIGKATLIKEDNKYQGISSKEIKSNYLKEHAKNDVNIVIDDDNSVIKYIIKNNEDLIVFQDSSLVD